MSVTHRFGRLVGRMAPSMANRLKNVWYTLNGGRIDALAEQSRQRHEYVDGRLAYIVAQLDDASRERNHDRARARIYTERDTAFTVGDSIRRLAADRPTGESRIAVVSVLPPMETGIANYTLRTFEACPVPVDVFAPFPDAGAYLAAVHRLPRPGSPITVHALQALSVALANHSYAAVVWVIGNSSHHLPVMRLLWETRHLAARAPTWVQLHDPVLFNLAHFHAEETGSDLAAMLRAAVTRPVPDAHWAAVAKGDISTVLDHPGLPARALFNSLPLHGIVLHSRAARDVLRPDWPDMDRLDQRLLYLPVTEPFTARPPRPPGALRIGSFGYPAASKGTDRIIAAFRSLRQRHPDAMLVLAGYHAGRYVQAEGLADEPGLELHDNPPEATLLALMSSVDVAVQLRMQNTGESSGIVPQLLARDVPTITSAIGAFAEYGEAVVALPGPRIDADLCATILAEAEDPLRHQAARRHYVETHGPVDFCRDLLRSDIAGR